MLIPLLMGTAMMIVNLGILIMTLVFILRLLTNNVRDSEQQPSLWRDTRILSGVLGVLIVGHLFQFGTWAALFMLLGEFSDFATAFYHSTVNFTSLGYGDIVMSERWRLLGALEAGNGVLMFALSASSLLEVMRAVFRHHRAKGP